MFSDKKVRKPGVKKKRAIYLEEISMKSATPISGKIKI